jgi:hypothetical protein
MATKKATSAARTVDPLSRSSTSAVIYTDEDGIWNAMMNFTDITYGQLGYVSISHIQTWAWFGREGS